MVEQAADLDSRSRSVGPAIDGLANKRRRSSGRWRLTVPEASIAGKQVSQVSRYRR